MKCPICKHGNTHAGVASITLERGNTTVMFKRVPAQVCENCGEVYHDAQVRRSYYNKQTRLQKLALKLM